MKPRITVRHEKDLVNGGRDENWKREMVLWGIKQNVFGMLKQTLEMAMLMERAEVLEKSRAENKGNGFRGRKSFTTTMGTLEDLVIPRDRAGLYQPGVLPRFKRQEETVEDLLSEIFLAGSSTRQTAELAKLLFGEDISHAQVSEFSKKLDSEVESFRKRPLKDEYVAIWIDGTYIPLRRYQSPCEKECVLLAIGLDTKGHIHPLSFELVGEEGASAWRDFLRDLKNRGLKGKNLKLVIMDDLTGLPDAVHEVFGSKVKVQLCILHKERNVLKYVPRHARVEIGEWLRRIYDAQTREEAIRNKEKFVERFAQRLPKATTSLSRHFEESLTVYSLGNPVLRKSLRTTNIIERAIKEVKRRIKPMEMLPSEASVYRIVYYGVKKLEKTWRTRKIKGYADLDLLQTHFS